MSASQSTRIRVAVLGATGAVGQTLVRLLDGHPWFELVEVAASGCPQGQRYGDAAHWRESAMPHAAAELAVLPCTPDAITAPIIFSALDASDSGTIEPDFARAGRFVLTNARNHRFDCDVPLVIPEVNPDHLALLEVQRERRGWAGAIIANGNCASIIVTLALAPLHRAFGIHSVFVTTLQAISGAGCPGVPSQDVVGNVIPSIGGTEEEQLQTEPLEMLGQLADIGVRPARFVISAQVNRVPVVHGHTANIAVELQRGARPDEAVDAFTSWRSAVADLGLPSAPECAISVTHAPDRPQPRRDACAGGGMTVTVGRIRRDPILDLRLVATGHDTIRGAAGASLLNAELLVSRGMIPV